MAHISVTPNWARVAGLDPVRLVDLIYNAPEPPHNQADASWLRAGSANLLYLDEQLPGAIWDDPHNRLFEAKAMRFLGRLRSTPPGDYELQWPFKLPCDPWQLPVFAYGRQLTNIALAPAALGCGKTKMTADIAADKWLRGEIDGLIVIAPNGVHRQWVTEGLPTHMSDAVPFMAHVWSPSRKIPKTWPLRIGTSFRRLRVMTFNVEAFSTESGRAAKAVRQILSTGRWMLVVDESTRIKNGGRIRTKTVLGLGRHPGCVARMILTGTPVTKGYEDFYNQYQFLDPEIIGLHSWWAFRNRYCVTIPAYRGAARNVVRVVGYKNQEELFRKLAPVTFMIGREVLGLAEPRHVRIEVELTAEQREVYGMMARRMVQRLEERNLQRPQNVLVELLRLQQILCGWVYEEAIDENGLETAIAKPIPSNRLGVLSRVLEDNDGQAVIWARFSQDIDAIAGMLKPEEGHEPDYVIYDGRVPNVVERERRKNLFRDGKVSRFISNPAAGGTGVDGLQEQCSFAVYYSNSYNREHRWQSEGRLYRRGQKQPVTYVNLVAPGTVDELFLLSYERTENLVQQIIGSPTMLTGGLE